MSGPAQKGGTFRYSTDNAIGYVDPALAYGVTTWQIEYATMAMLMSYPGRAGATRLAARAGGPAGHARHLEGRQDLYLHPEEDVSLQQRCKGVFYTCNTGACVPTALLVQDNLKAVGLDMEIKPFPRSVQYTKTGTRGEPFDMTLVGWRMDYFNPYDFLFLLDGTTIRERNNNNLSPAHTGGSWLRRASSDRRAIALSESWTSTLRRKLCRWRLSPPTTLGTLSRGPAATSTSRPTSSTSRPSARSSPMRKLRPAGGPP